MIKIRLMGTTNELKWFVKILSRDKRFVLKNPSEPLNIKGSKKYKRIMGEIYRSDDKSLEKTKEITMNTSRQNCGSGMTLGLDD